MNPIVFIGILLLLFYIILLNIREWLVFYRNTACGKKMEPSKYNVETFSLQESSGWLVRQINATTNSLNKSVYVIVMGAGGAKCCYIDIIKSCFQIDSDATVCIIDHLGYGDTRLKHRATMAGVHDYIFQTKRHLLQNGYKDLIWVTHCIGTIFLLKTPGIFDDDTKQSVIIINGLVNWYSKGVGISHGLQWIPRVLGSVTKTSIRNELDARAELAELLRKEIPIISIHTRNNKHIPISHGHCIKAMIGSENYHEIKHGRHTQLDLSLHPDALLFILDRFHANQAKTS